MTFAQAASRGASGLFVIAAILLFCSLSCNTASTSEQSAASSDAELQDALDRLRKDEAPGPGCGRRPLIARVEKVSAVGPAATDAKQACVRAYSALCEAEDAIFRAEVLIKAESDPARPLGNTAAEVVAADALLQKAKAAMPECDSAAAKFALGHR